MQFKGEKILEALQLIGKDQKWLAEKLGIEPALVSRWVNNKVIPVSKNIIKISELLKRKTEYFYEIAYAIKEPSVQYAGSLTDSNMINLAVLARVPAGMPEFSEDDVEAHIYIPRFMYPGARIAVYCKSDSMEPDIMKGERRPHSQRCSGRPLKRLG